MNESSPPPPPPAGRAGPADRRPRRRPLLTRAFPNVLRLTLVIVLVGLVWRVVRYLLNFPMWGDEAFLAMSLLVRDFHTVLVPPLEHHQIAPLGYLWLGIADVHLLGPREWVLRLPAFLASVGASFPGWG